MEKQPYYIDLASGEIQSRDDVSPWNFRVFANDKEIRSLREMLTGMNDAEFGSFWRAHLPGIPYHEDADNDQYDRKLTSIYEKIYELGDEDAREYIKKWHNNV